MVPASGGIKAIGVGTNGLTLRSDGKDHWNLALALSRLSI